MSASDHLKTQEMCNKAVEKDSCLLVFVPDRLRTQEMLGEAVSNRPWQSCIPDHVRTQETCNEIKASHSRCISVVL